MVDIVPTSTLVVPSSSATLVQGKAGAAINAGQIVYRAAATGLFHLADSNVAGETRQPIGMAVTTAAINQSIVVCTSGDVTTQVAWTAGSYYYLSETAGGIQPVADLGATEQVISIGFARTTSVIAIQINNTGVIL